MSSALKAIPQAFVAAIVFWGSDLLYHLARGDAFGAFDIVPLSLLLPAVTFLTYLGMKTAPWKDTKPALAISMILGIWIGGPTMLEGRGLLLNVSGVDVGGSVWLYLLMTALFPIYTFIISIHDVSAFGLFLTTLILALVGLRGDSRRVARDQARRGHPNVLRLMLVLALPLLLGAKSNKWVRLAEHDLTFARGLASDGVKFGLRFKCEVIEGRVHKYGCDARPSKLVGVDNAEIRQIQLYSEHYCYPWLKTWAYELWPCDGLFVPKWCKSGNEELAAAHLKVGPYFEHLTTALSGTAVPLERFNIMAVIADRLSDKMLRDYPRSALGVLVSKAMSDFLESAQPEEALEIGWRVPWGESPSLAQVYRAYVDRVQIATVEQQRLLEDVAHAIETDLMLGAVRTELFERYGCKEVPPPPPPPDRTDSSDIALLIKRIDEYYGLMREGRYLESWNLMTIDYREGYSQEGYVRTWKRHYEGILDWKVCQIQISSNTAKVFITAYRKERVADRRGKESSVREDYSFWVFESGGWYKHIPGPAFWGIINKIVEVPVPTVGATGDGCLRSPNQP